MDAQEIRQKYLEFFKKQGHVVVDRAPLVLHDDPTTLFTGSGMQPMIPYLLGEPHSQGKRIANSQTCLRVQDIEEVGDNRHTTFFEMLGNWSLGDYFKQEQIHWMWEFLSEVIGLDMSRVYVTCYSGDDKYNIPKDTEAAEIWAELYRQAGLSCGQADIGSEEDGYERGIRQGERIFYYDGSKNWWSRNGGPETTPIGDPCGPDSEIFYDFGTPHDTKYGKHCHPNCECGRFMEIGNNVFMAYKKIADGVFEPLEAPNIDQGSGLERLSAAKINDPDIFKTSLFWPIIEKLQDLSGKKYEDNLESMRVIADHLRASTFLAVDGCVPSNKEQGYVMRRLLRRAIRHANVLGIRENFFEEVVTIIADLYKADFPELMAEKDKIIITLMREEKAFNRTLMNGMRHLRRFVDGGLTGNELFKLHDTYGFPIELSVEIAKQENIKLADNWKRIFDRCMAEQRQRSQTATKGAFKGGLEGQTIEHAKLHTANHLVLSALRQILGDHVTQRGSNITTERLRFDFSHDTKVTREQLDQVENLVNGWIEQDLPIVSKECPTEEALKMGATGEFGDKYGDRVKVYQIGNDDGRVSLEICGGPHVERTGQLAEGGKRFKILKEKSSSAGVRRIRAVLQ